MRFANTMPGVAVVGDAGDIADFSGQAASPRAGNATSAMPSASPATATPGMVLPYQYEDYGRGSPCNFLSSLSCNITNMKFVARSYL